MNKEMTALKFYFRNGETWTVNRRHIDDLWIKQITASSGWINGSEFVEIHSCAGFKIEIFHEGDVAATHDINPGGLEMGMFNRALKYEDIERMKILYRNDAPDPVYFSYLDKGTEGLDDQYQSTKIGEKTGNLYIVINSDRRVEDVYGEFLEWIGSYVEMRLWKGCVLLLLIGCLLHTVYSE